MAPLVIDMDECADASIWKQRAVSQFIRRVVVTRQSKSRGDNRAQTAPPDGLGRGGKNNLTTRIFRKLASTPMLLIRNQGASLFKDLELEWPRHVTS
jgi:hypothetical protein